MFNNSTKLWIKTKITRRKVSTRRRGNPIGPKKEMFMVLFHVYELILPGLRLSPLTQNQNGKDEQVTFRIHDLVNKGGFFLGGPNCAAFP